MEPQKDSDLKMFTIALLIIALLADHSEAGTSLCHFCQVPEDPYENCEVGPPRPTNTQYPEFHECKISNTCWKYVERAPDGELIRLLRGCWGIEDCTGLRSGCKTYDWGELKPILDRCGLPRKGVANLTTILKPSKERTGGEGRQESNSYQICVCTGYLCLANEEIPKVTTTTKKEYGGDWEEAGATKVTIGGMIIMMAIAIAIKSII